MTTEIVEAMERELHPRGTIVVIEAEHFCMSMRGVKKAGRDDGHVGGARRLSRRRVATGPRRCSTSINDGLRGVESRR